MLVDFYGVTFIAFILALLQLYSFCYIYGVARICKDINFMLGFYPGWIWIICWRFLTPGLMTIIVIYNFVFFKLPTDGAYPFPQKAHIVGWCIFSIGMLQIPIFASYQIYKENGPLWNVRIKILEGLPNKIIITKMFFRELKARLSLQPIGGRGIQQYFKNIRSPIRLI